MGHTFSSVARKCAASAIIIALSTSTALAMESGQTARGGAFVSGGIGAGEIAALDAQRGKYSLWLITAAKTSGAYLADVRIRITDEKKATVLQTTMAGPWLLVDLPVGRYEVEASYRGQTFDRPTTIHAGDHHQMVFYFDVAADVLPKDAAEAARK
ncbi:MAG: carboxypeptidase regulatory-like domain-containing protein [Gemmatimonadota bacterium]